MNVVSLQGIADFEAKAVELNGKREKLESEMAELLASLRTETAELQERKDVLQTQLVELNKNVVETKSAVSFTFFLF